MSLSEVTVTWDEADIAQIALGGTVTFALSEPLADQTTGATYSNVPPRSYFFTAGTGSSDPLIANDSTDLTPAGSYYTITVSVRGQQSYNFTTAINHANGATQTLGYLQANQVLPGTQGFQYMLLPSGTAVAGEVPVATGTGGTSAWGGVGPQLAQAAIQAANYVASANQIVPVNTTSGSVTVTLPNAPAAGTLLAVKQVIQGTGNAVSVVTQGSDVFNKAGGSTSLALSLANQGILLEYNSGIWMDLADDLPLSQLDLRYAPLGSDGHLSASYTPRPSLYAPTGLRRFRAAAGDSLFSQIPVVCVGDSITAGQGGDNNTSVFSNVPDNSNGWVGQLRALFATGLGSYPGEGFIFADDSRVTLGGGATNNNWPCVPLRHGPRMLHGSGWTLALTVPNGVTLLGVIQANETQAFNSAGSNLADVSALYSQTGSVTVTNQPVTTLTNTGLPVETDITCQPGDVITISAPATAQSYVAGFSLKNGNPGVLVHRVGQSGYVSGDMLGGQTSGVLNQAASSSNQQTAERACYYWAGTTGLIVVSFATNDQSGQASTGAAGGVTLAPYTAWMEQFVTQAVADGWCVLIKGDNRNPNAYSGGSSLDQYQAAMKAFALATDHVAYIDVGELWGSAAAAALLSLVNSNSVHPLRRGHGDIARTLYRVLAAAGITELVAA